MKCATIESRIIYRVLLVCLLAVAACKNSSNPKSSLDQKPEPSSEPNEYSATVVRAVEGVARQELSVTSSARLGELRREEWKNGQQQLAAIWRPDIGKVYLLDIGQKTYTENEITQSQHQVPVSDVEYFEDKIDDAPSAERIETDILPDTRIDGFTCSVYETRTYYQGGHSQVVRTFRARELGLAMRVEVEAPDGSRLVTERHDVKTVVPRDIFEISSDFRRVSQLNTSQR
jgi:hypothetical protein